MIIIINNVKTFLTFAIPTQEVRNVSVFLVFFFLFIFAPFVIDV